MSGLRNWLERASVERGLRNWLGRARVERGLAFVVEGGVKRGLERDGERCAPQGDGRDLHDSTRG